MGWWGWWRKPARADGADERCHEHERDRQRDLEEARMRLRRLEDEAAVMTREQQRPSS